MIQTRTMFYNKLIIRLLLVIVITGQILTVFRSTSIFNSEYISNVLNLIFMAFVFFVIATRVQLMRFNLNTLLLILIPSISFCLGLYLNDFSRYLVSDTVSALFFILLILYMQATGDIECLFDEIAKWMLIGLIVTFVIYTIFPLLGYSVFSVGKISIYFIFPFIYYFIKRNYLISVVALALIFWGTKRGVLLALFAFLLIYLFLEKKVSFKIRIFILAGLVVVLSLVGYITTSNARVEALPVFQSLFFKLSILNPASENFSLENDYRILEIMSSLVPIKENSMLLLTGMGPGYMFDVTLKKQVLMEASHNVHFSPVSLLTRYGIIYVAALTLFFGRVIVKSMIFISSPRCNVTHKAALYYVICSLLFSLTAFTIYVDYLCMICLGYLMYTLKNNRGHHDENKNRY